MSEPSVNKTEREERLDGYTPSQLMIKELVEKNLAHTIHQMKPVLEAAKDASDKINRIKESIIVSKELEISSVNSISFRDHKLDVLNEISKKLDSKFTQAPNEYIIIYNTKYSTLSRIVDGVELTCDLAENGKRKSFIDLLLKVRTYMTTEKVKEHLNCPTNDSVSALKKSINTKLQFELSLGTVKFLEGKQGSGYRINPKVTIQKVK